MPNVDAIKVSKFFSTFYCHQGRRELIFGGLTSVVVVSYRAAGGALPPLPKYLYCIRK